jgi:hypothetical protein
MAMAPSDHDHAKTPFELAEIVGLLLLVAATLIVLAEVIAAVMAAFSSPGVPSGFFQGVPSIPGPSIADTVSRATEWATPVFPMLLLGVLATAWWQIQGWTEVVDDSEQVDEGALTAAFAHLLRARALSNATLVLSVILIAGVVGSVVATFIGNVPGQTSIVVVSGYFEVIGVGLATCLLACAGIWAGFRFWSSVNETFAQVEDGASDDDPEE